MIEIFTCMILGAIGWHFRGGGWIDLGSTQAARLIGIAILVAPLVYFSGNLALLGLIVTLFVGVATIGWGDFFDMGTTEGKSEETLSPLVKFWLDPKGIWHDIVGMSLCGIWLTIPSVLLLWFLSVPYEFILLIAGALIGPIYYISWHWLPHFTFPLVGRHDQSPHGPISMAEVLTGATLGLFLSIILL
jgi:hypothetical protein